MSTESDIAAALAAARLRAVRMALLSLHKVLLDAERARYAAANGPIESPHRALQLVLKDPWFAWLRPISELIVEADERLSDDRPVAAEEAEAYAGRALGLLQQDLGGVDFRREYHRSLQELPDAVMAHAAVVKLASPSRS
jgi:hypothetical protein